MIRSGLRDVINRHKPIERFNNNNNTDNNNNNDTDCGEWKIMQYEHEHALCIQKVDK